MTIRAAVFASGGGSNLQALLDNERDGGPYRIELVISDRSDAGALDRARRLDREARVIEVRDRDRAEVETETRDALNDAGIGVIFLAGYLRLIPGGVVRAFPRRILNIHPALLPAFGGKGMWGHHVHEAVLQAGARLSGPTIHYVDEAYDTGTIIAQWPVPVLPGDSPDTLAARVLAVEHLLYPAVADHVSAAVAAGRPAAPFEPRGDVFIPASGSVPAEIRRHIQEGLPSS
jgi:formyltetrahydrofolate-dependent phosphoribosylglycinamide formyltransferase